MAVVFANLNQFQTAVAAGDDAVLGSSFEHQRCFNRCVVFVVPHQIAYQVEEVCFALGRNCFGFAFAQLRVVHCFQRSERSGSCLNVVQWVVLVVHFAVRHGDHAFVVQRVCGRQCYDRLCVVLCAELGGFAFESRRSCVARKRGHALQHVVNHLRTDALNVCWRAVFLFDEVAKLRSKLLHGVAAIIQRSNVFGRQAAGNACLFAALTDLGACRDEQLIDRHNGCTEHRLHFLHAQHAHDDGLNALPRIHQVPPTLGQLLL